MKSLRIDCIGNMNTRVWVDGVEQKELYSVKFVHLVHNTPELELGYVMGKE
jgi:hypothetical protein